MQGPGARRGYQLYSPAVKEAEIIFQRVTARKRKEKNMSQKSRHPEHAVARAKMGGSGLPKATPLHPEGTKKYRPQRLLIQVT